MNSHAEEVIASEYRKIYADFSVEADEGRVHSKEAADELVRRIKPRLESGELVISPDQQIRDIASRVRKSDGKATDVIIDRLRGGQDAIPMPAGDPALDLLVILGDGYSKQWSQVTIDDLDQMDRARYKNVRDAQNSYDRWRANYEPVRIVLRSYATVGEAVEARAFDSYDFQDFDPETED